MSALQITVLMCTYNGAPYLAQQLQSFLAQTCTAWALWISDDGSNDDTWAILERFQADHPHRDIRLFHGPRKGVAANFLSLLSHPDLDITRPVALSDQDDVWLPHRLSRALNRIGPSSRDTPVLYGSCTIVTDAQLQNRRLSRRYLPAVSFKNALVQNVVAGNTMVLNPAALEIVRSASVRDPGAGALIPYQDWWLYLLLSGAGAQIVLDKRPGLLYRQHAHNTFGLSLGRHARLQRILTVIRGGYGHWVWANLTALQQIADLLTPENQRTLARFTQAASRGRWHTLMLLPRLGIRRETRSGTMALYCAILLGRLQNIPRMTRRSD